MFEGLEGESSQLNLSTGEQCPWPTLLRMLTLLFAMLPKEITGWDNAVPGELKQQDWQSTLISRRSGTWCRTNSNWNYRKSSENSFLRLTGEFLLRNPRTWVAMTRGSSSPFLASVM
jgi:hypothetical protein